MLSYLTYNTGIELFCFIIALLCLPRDKSYAWQSAIFYLLIVCTIEMTGIYVMKKPLVTSNTLIFNLLFIFEIAFFSLMFQSLLSKYFNSKPLIYTGLAILIISYITELLTNCICNRTHISIIIQGVIFVFYSLTYFYFLIKDEHYVKLGSSAEFWWVAAVLLYYFATTVLNVFYQELAKLLHKPFEAFRLIRLSANISLYTLWAYAFICRKWLTQRSKI